MTQGITEQVRERLEHMETEIARLQDDNISLREEIEHRDEFVVACTELIPEGYDNDEAAEAIILRYLKDLDTLAGIIARLTSGYR